MIPRPPPLTSEEFHKRAAALQRAGRPLTFENLDPEFHRYHRRFMRGYLIRTNILVAAFMLALWLIALALINRNGGAR